MRLHEKVLLLNGLYESEAPFKVTEGVLYLSIINEANCSMSPLFTVSLNMRTFN